MIIFLCLENEHKFPLILYLFRVEHDCLGWRLTRLSDFCVGPNLQDE
jgi:hypothetical protein